MTKLNNKGFAVSTILYGLIIMTSLIFMLILSNLSATKVSNDELVSSLEKELNTCINSKTNPC